MRVSKTLKPEPTRLVVSTSRFTRVRLETSLFGRHADASLDLEDLLVSNLVPRFGELV